MRVVTTFKSKQRSSFQDGKLSIIETTIVYSFVRFVVRLWLENDFSPIFPHSPVGLCTLLLLNYVMLVLSIFALSAINCCVWCKGRVTHRNLKLWWVSAILCNTVEFTLTEQLLDKPVNSYSHCSLSYA
jgi:hypothetical protein